MKKIIVILFLFASCQVQENRPAPKAVAKIAEEPIPAKEQLTSSKIILPQPQPPAVDEKAGSDKTREKKSVSIKSSSSTSNLIENPVPGNEMIEANTIKTDSSSPGSGGGSYDEGYIPFIKQYW